jgi:hypothetical protein
MPLSSVVGAQSIIKPGVCTSSTRPAVPYVGQCIYETDTSLAKVWDGSAWSEYPPAKANLASPTFTGTPSAPTATAGTNTTQLATTAFVTTANNLKANLASPTFTGTVAAPTVNATTYQQSGYTGSIVRSAGVSVTFTTTPTTFLVNMPSGCNVNNLIACHPTTGVNNTVTVTSIRYGDWSGIQSSTQIAITGSLGNGVHLEAFNVNFYWLG